MVTTVLNAGYRVGSAVRARTVSEVNQGRLQRPFAPATTWYDLLTGYYRNSMYDVLRAGAYKGGYGLPRSLRGIYNPTKRAVDWYPGHVYPDGYDPVPFASGTAPEIEAAVNVAFETWGNWSRIKTIYVRTGAMLGNVLIEIEADTERGKLYPVIRNPRDVTHVEMNTTGDLTALTIELPLYDEGRQQGFLWGRRTTRESVTTLYNGEPHGYDDQPAEIENPFPFVPAVWVPHTMTGDTLGAPVIEEVIGKIDELNAIVTSAHDYIQRFNKQGVVLKTKASAKELIPLFGKRGATASQANPYSDVEDLPFIKGPEDLGILRLLENLGLGDADPYRIGMLDEISADLPEIKFDHELRQMQETSGIGAMRMSGDIVNRLTEAQGNYDWGLVRAAQMALTMGSILARVRVDGWAAPTDARKTFLEFDERSFDDGELDFKLSDRPLLPETQAERIANARAVEALTTPTGMEMAGISDEQIYGAGPDGEPLRPQTAVGLLAEQEEAQRRRSTGSILNFNAGLGG
jgi:hypothetical protein